ADERGVERSYKVGETVAGNARLAEVYADHVVLNHDGIAEALNLPRPEEHAPALAETNVARATGTAPASSMPPGYAAKSSANAAARATVAGRLPIPDELARQVHIEPVFDNGKLTGARLSGGGAVAILMGQAGLRPTDVVTSVNGMPLSSLSNPQQL